MHVLGLIVNDLWVKVKKKKNPGSVFFTQCIHFALPYICFVGEKTLTLFHDYRWGYSLTW